MICCTILWTQERGSRGWLLEEGSVRQVGVIPGWCGRRGVSAGEDLRRGSACEGTMDHAMSDLVRPEVMW